MAYACKILADSENACGNRLTTFEVTFPRIVLAEFNTHRMFSRNSASSRAIPVEKQIRRVIEDPFVPVYWGKNQKGMQANQELELEDQERARRSWLVARDEMIARTEALLEIGVHKQITNRLLEPFQWHTVIVSATEYDNFFGLRCNPEAQPEIRIIAEMMDAMMTKATPQALTSDRWHLPLISMDDIIEASGDQLFLARVSAGRCARVSYLTHDGRRDMHADFDLCARLVASGHMSPLEHVAHPMGSSAWCGNFKGWRQLRKTIPGESVRAR